MIAQTAVIKPFCTVTVEYFCENDLQIDGRGIGHTSDYPVQNVIGV